MKYFGPYAHRIRYSVSSDVTGRIGTFQSHDEAVGVLADWMLRFASVNPTFRVHVLVLPHRRVDSTLAMTECHLLYSVAAEGGAYRVTGPRLDSPLVLSGIEGLAAALADCGQKEKRT